MAPYVQAGAAYGGRPDCGCYRHSYLSLSFFTSSGIKAAPAEISR